MREFSSEVLALADADFEVDIASLPEQTPLAPTPQAARPRPQLPGADVFPAEEDDDRPILAALDEPKESKEGKEKVEGMSEEEDREGRRRRRRPRRRRGKGEAEEPRPAPAPREHRDRDDRRREREREREPDRRPPRESLDWNRQPDEGDLVGRDLADAVAAVLDQAPREVCSFARVAELLVRRNRLAGSPAALAPTVAAALRADAVRSSAGRFRFVNGGVALTQWYLPKEAVRLEQDVRGALRRQREQVHRAFLRKIMDLPAAGFAELMATWLNAEGITALRGVRRATSSGTEVHMAGVLRRGHEEIRVAIAILRDGRELGAEKIVEVRGALHHYGNASMAWVLTTGPLRRNAREEVEVAGAPACVLFDGMGLAQAMEARGVGLRPLTVALAGIDLDLLDGLRGETESLGRPREERRERREAREPSEARAEGEAGPPESIEVELEEGDAASEQGAEARHEVAERGAQEPSEEQVEDEDRDDGGDDLEPTDDEDEGEEGVGEEDSAADDEDDGDLDDDEDEDEDDGDQDEDADQDDGDDGDEDGDDGDQDEDEEAVESSAEPSDEPEPTGEAPSPRRRRRGRRPSG
ncbi:MAG: restriction endonuclease [Sandaracinaceae bacterium]|nr:restriction endonuclease [Sandaracinaceae bacterium]